MKSTLEHLDFSIYTRKQARSKPHGITAFLSINALAILLTYGSAGATNAERDSLSGVRTVCVLVESFSQKDREFGFDERDIKTTVELRLRQSGIKVDNKVSCASAIPHLYINIQSLPVETIAGRFIVLALNIDVSFRQAATLDIGNKRMFVNTWGKAYLMLADINSIHNRSRNGLNIMLDRFLNDYLAANQK